MVPVPVPAAAARSGSGRGAERRWHAARRHAALPARCRPADMDRRRLPPLLPLLCAAALGAAGRLSARPGNEGERRRGGSPLLPLFSPPFFFPLLLFFSPSSSPSLSSFSFNFFIIIFIFPFSFLRCSVPAAGGAP